jgi:hypothetical protein
MAIDIIVNAKKTAALKILFTKIIASDPEIAIIETIQKTILPASGISANTIIFR